MKPIQEKVTGKIYTAINYVLRGLGFDEKQIEYQRNKWIEDKVISKGTLKFSGTFYMIFRDKNIRKDFGKVGYDNQALADGQR